MAGERWKLSQNSVQICTGYDATLHNTAFHNECLRNKMKRAICRHKRIILWSYREVLGVSWPYPSVPRSGVTIWHNNKTITLSTRLWDVMPRSLLPRGQLFARTYCFHLRNRKLNLKIQHYWKEFLRTSWLINWQRMSRRSTDPKMKLYVCPFIIYENDERYQLDATILFIIINNSTCFGHLI